MSNTITPLLAALREQKAMKLKGGIYHKTQIDLTYNSNHIEGSRLTHDSMQRLITSYEAQGEHTLEDILDFHVRFEKIHPFQDGNGRVGRLVMFKECLRSGVVPFIITDELKMFYYRGLREWGHIDGYLTDTCLTAQDQYKAALDYFRIEYA